MELTTWGRETSEPAIMLQNTERYDGRMPDIYITGWW